MRLLIKYNWFILLVLIGSACNQKRINGTFIYTESNEETSETKSMLSLGAEMGRKMTCASIGLVEFKGNKCYFSADFLGLNLENESRYHISNNVIYIGSDYLQRGGINVFKIIDENTISYQGCLFKKADFTKYQNGKVLNKVNLRDSPSLEGRILTTVDKHKEIFVTGKSIGDWYKVRYNSKVGFIHTDFVEILKD